MMPNPRPAAEWQQQIRDLVWRYLADNRHLEPTVNDLWEVADAYARQQSQENAKRTYQEHKHMPHDNASCLHCQDAREQVEAVVELAAVMVATSPLVENDRVRKILAAAIRALKGTG